MSPTGHVIWGCAFLAFNLTMLPVFWGARHRFPFAGVALGIAGSVYMIAEGAFGQ